MDDFFSFFIGNYTCISNCLRGNNSLISWSRQLQKSYTFLYMFYVRNTVLKYIYSEWGITFQYKAQNAINITLATSMLRKVKA